MYLTALEIVFDFATASFAKRLKPLIPDTSRFVVEVDVAQTSEIGGTNGDAETAVMIPHRGKGQWLLHTHCSVGTPLANSSILH
jgi:hypothetical protein